MSFIKENDDNKDVDYGFYNDPVWLDRKTKEIASTDINILSDNEKLAFYINAYNILTVWAVRKKLKKNPSWKGNTSYIRKIKFFYLSKYVVAGKKINLYNLENKILRKKFNEPRIHFAINCASISCPPLPNKIISAENIHSQLDLLTSNFINDGVNVKYNKKQNILEVNSIFKWYEKDFKGQGGILLFIKNHLSKNIINERTKLKFLPYNWNLKI
ncbi:MAG: hypothetical protein HeimC3_41510 [Candidatus Heimdallarchaeota archaeon LC_3]|nr:MAG: hypothetical protein HeimC3_41510 [Candidatus Heimdallarchaeota archaeon LC_3]